MSPRSILSLPLYLLQLATGAKSFEDNPILGSRTLNRWGLHASRVSLAHRLATGRRRALAARLTEEDRTAFDRDGFVARRDFLPRAVFEDLRDQVRRFDGPILEKTEGRSILRKVPVSPRVIERVPALDLLARTARFQDLVRYAGARDAAPNLFLQSVVQQATRGEVDPQTLLHADTFHPTVKAWLFLTDVAEDEGPFTYVPGSHRLSPERLEWERATSLVARASDDAMTREGSFRIDAATVASLGLPPAVPVAVPANTLVVADTFGFHARGQSVRPSLRVEVWAIGRRNPFLPFVSTDRLVAGLGRVRRGEDHWTTLDTASMFDMPTLA